MPAHGCKSRAALGLMQGRMQGAVVLLVLIVPFKEKVDRGQHKRIAQWPEPTAAEDIYIYHRVIDSPVASHTPKTGGPIMTHVSGPRNLRGYSSLSSRNKSSHGGT